jgi:Spy/CpxP family protein refolding chaperone
MRKAIAFLGLLLLPAAVFAQQGPGRRGGREFQANLFERILQHKTDLALSADQVSKLEVLSKQLQEKQKPIIDEMRQQREAGVRRDQMTEEQREAARKNMEKLRDQREEALASLKSVLTDEQQTKVKSMLEDRRGDRRGRRQHGGPERKVR